MNKKNIIDNNKPTIKTANKAVSSPFSQDKLLLKVNELTLNSSPKSLNIQSSYKSDSNSLNYKNYKDVIESIINISCNGNLNEFYNDIYSIILDNVNSQFFAVGIFKEQSGCINLRLQDKLKNNYTTKIFLKDNDNPIIKVFNTQKPMFVKDKDYLKLFYYKNCSTAIYPLLSANKCIGVFIVEDVNAQQNSTIYGLIAKYIALVTHNIYLQEKSEEFVNTDGLTLLYNHRGFQDILSNEIKRARTNKNPLSIIMMDINNITKINREQGHAKGDEVIKLVAEKVRQNVRESDIAGRYGGDEIAVILPNTNSDQAKYVAEYYGNLSFPFKRYQIGKVYRGEKAQAGRYREFYQCDVDIIGDGELSVIYDAEIPSIIYTTFKELGFDKFTIHINNRKILNGLFEALDVKNNSVDILRIIDKIDKIGKENVVKEISELGVSEDKINTIMDFIEITGNIAETIAALRALNISNELFETGVNELEEVSKNIKLFGVPEQNYKIDLTIARGLDYYTGTVYETFLNEYRSLGSVCSGGRYDNLAEYYTDRKLPGVGVSIGLTRLFFQLNDKKIIEAGNRAVSKALIISMVEDVSKAIEVATELRNAGINCQVYTDQGKIKKQFNYANRNNIPYVIVIGEDEIANNVVSLKNMDSGEQINVCLEEAIRLLK